MKTLINKISAFLADEQGAETVEWVVVVALVVVVAIAIYDGILKSELTAIVQGISTKLDAV